ncbi:nucleotide sugar dehydrogenase [Aurantimonas sp. MSK8Z-1]|uniref:nucleotide sugar dehydrogenase n=1 Tax=Mangrovibrevibacter kandeliae TaxID=2968473 RepID=UPI00211976AF|nr:nucleotide sugar dehydrogenase [Aurantimonas sp. MSK8Z-1]MCW4117013.1 nucleotide sugar dehydrogenase [Aurantimonas sp. MSK8Z-1]
MTTVGFAGMTHLGLVSASAIAGKGFSTVCYDGDAALVGRLRAGRLPVVEPELDDLVAANGARQVFTADLEDLSRCNVVYIAPDIPTDDQGRSDTAVIHRLIDAVAPVLGPDAVMVVLSQVEPGFTRALRQPELSRRFYQVETLVFGRAVERATLPERYIVGCADPARPLPPHFAAVLEAFDCPILPMRYESAELAKISINFCLVSSISVANTLSEVCEAIGADWSEIVPALKLDRRIGQYSYLAPGLGIAGGNLERDLATVQRIGAARGTDTDVVAAWKSNSRHRRDWAARTIKRELLNATPEATVAIWGLAYKENTHSVKNSPSLATIAQLPDAVRLRVHDPVVDASAADRASAEGVDDPLAALDGAEALLILTPWPLYRGIDPQGIAARLSGRLVLDPYRILDPQAAVSAGLVYHTLGRSAATA